MNREFVIPSVEARIRIKKERKKERIRQVCLIFQKKNDNSIQIKIKKTEEIRSNKVIEWDLQQLPLVFSRLTNRYFILYGDLNKTAGHLRK
jgi:hypothetical protein